MKKHNQKLQVSDGAAVQELITEHQPVTVERATIAAAQAYR